MWGLAQGTSFISIPNPLERGAIEGDSPVGGEIKDESLMSRVRGLGFGFGMWENQLPILNIYETDSERVL